MTIRTTFEVSDHQANSYDVVLLDYRKLSYKENSYEVRYKKLYCLERYGGRAVLDSYWRPMTPYTSMEVKKVFKTLHMQEAQHLNVGKDEMKVLQNDH